MPPLVSQEADQDIRGSMLPCHHARREGNHHRNDRGEDTAIGLEAIRIEIESGT